MPREDALTEIGRHGVVPVVTIERIEMALPLADALLAAGLPVMEVTFRTPIAADVIRLLSLERPQMLIGAGTILSIDNLRSAKRSGARFAVAPGLNRAVAEDAVELELPLTPGVATPSEIELALSLGCRLLKLFPAAILGGPALLKILAGPYGHTGMRMMPSGGVTAETMADYLAAPLVSAVGGTWIASKPLLEVGRYDEIRNLARIAVETVARVRA